VFKFGEQGKTSPIHAESITSEVYIPEEKRHLKFDNRLKAVRMLNPLTDQEKAKS